jgi:hypothetical protein
VTDYGFTLDRTLIVTGTSPGQQRYAIEITDRRRAVIWAKFLARRRRFRWRAKRV